MKINTNNIVVPINKIKLNNYNPKKDYMDTKEGEKMYDQIKKSIKINGQIGAILVRELDNGNYEIVNGQHRFLVAQELKAKEIEIKNLGKISRENAIKKAIMTNETRIPVDQLELAELLKDLAKNESLQKLADELPYSFDQIKEKIDLLSFNWVKPDKEEKNDIEKFVVRIFFDNKDQKEKFVNFLNDFKKTHECSEGAALELIVAKLQKGC